MNKRTLAVPFFTLAAIALTEGVLIASPAEPPRDPDLALIGPLRADAYPFSDTGERLHGADFSVPVLPGFVGVANERGDVVLSSRTARIDVVRRAAVDGSQCASMAHADGVIEKHGEQWRADG